MNNSCVVSIDCESFRETLLSMWEINNTAFAFWVNNMLVVQNGRNNDDEPIMMMEYSVQVRKMAPKSVDGSGHPFCWEINIPKILKVLKYAKSVKFAFPPFLLFIDADWGEVIISCKRIKENIPELLITPSLNQTLESDFGFLIDFSTWKDAISLLCDIILLEKGNKFSDSEIYLNLENNVFLLRHTQTGAAVDDGLEIRIPIVKNSLIETHLENAMVLSPALLKLTCTQTVSKSLRVFISSQKPLCLHYEFPMGASLNFFLAPLE